MSFRYTLILIGILALLGGVAYFGRKTPTLPPPPPQTWDIDLMTITRVEVNYQGKKAAFLRGEDKSTWYFDEPGREEVNLERWSGIPLLLSGPRSRRLLEWKPDPAKLPEYGFSRPTMEIGLGLEGGGSGTILVGDKTPDGAAYYMMIQGFTPLYLVDYTWVEVLGRLVTEPPRLKATPIPVPQG